MIEQKGSAVCPQQQSGTAFLVADDRRASYSRKTGEFQRVSESQPASLKPARGLTTVVMFILIPYSQNAEKTGCAKNRRSLGH